MSKKWDPLFFCRFFNDKSGCHWFFGGKISFQRREDTQQMVGLVGVAAGSATAMMTAGVAGELGIPSRKTMTAN